jgi:hypothetical protein
VTDEVPLLVGTPVITAVVELKAAQIGSPAASQFVTGRLIALSDVIVAVKLTPIIPLKF